jgi:glycerate dehydrogenase
MNAPNIVVLDGYTIDRGDDVWAQLRTCGDCTIHARTAPALVMERARDADVVLTSKVQLDEGILRALPRLRYVSLLATGYDNVDVAAAGRLGIPVSNVPGYAVASVAQTAFALLLELVIGVGLHDAAVKAGEWERCPDHAFWKKPILELDGLTLGIVGYGRNGRAVARIGSAFGMRLIAYTPRLPQYAGQVSIGFVSLEQLFARSDVVTLTCPQTAENVGFVDARLLATMKPGAFLINVARGGLVDERALSEALRAGRIAGAGVDVIAHEPMRPGHPLLEAPNCVFTPHLAWASVAARRRLLTAVAENVASFLAGSPRNVVNRDELRPARPVPVRSAEPETSIPCAGPSQAQYGYPSST